MPYDKCFQPMVYPIKLFRQWAAVHVRRNGRVHGAKHIRSAPYHPSTNGLAERFVQLLKQALKSSLGSGRPDLLAEGRHPYITILFRINFFRITC